MAATLTNLLYHIVFSTKERRPLIDQDFSDRLHSYVGGIVRANNALALEVGGMSDHIHVLIKLRASASLSHMVQLIKSGSSKWVHDHIRQPAFAWQTGYGAFTLSESLCPKVRQYVQEQKEHHLRYSFEDEYQLLLKKHGIAFEPK